MALPSLNIRFHNTLTRQLEPFVPEQAPKVLMYNCGPTVYDFAHIGNFRAFVFADTLRRFLELAGYEVDQVMNITDVGHMTDDQAADGGGEDKMQLAARRMKEAKKSGKAEVDNPDDPYQISAYFTKAFLEDAKVLRLKIADEYPQHMPRATQHVSQMQAMIRKLIDAGHAYVASDGAVYYSVESFPEYGKLSGNTLDKIRGGAGGRVLDEHQQVKRHPADFLLWKPDATHIMKWDSPWGAGYPGWHIECSAMATTVLGRDVIDIHTGGEDNIFPHHECEIAQTCGATGHTHFARYWMHTRFLLVEGQKMSKRLGNFFTIRDLLAKGAEPAAIRYELMRSHYRSNMDFTFKGLEDATSAVRRLRQLAVDLEQIAGDAKGKLDAGHPLLMAFGEALADDLNVSGALGALFSWAKEDHKDPAADLAALRQVDHVLAMLDAPKPANDDGLATRCKAIDDARKRKDFAAADQLRKQLIDDGYEVSTNKDGTTARRKLT
ncbi:MAG: cysteine--tRNA ligase [Phycisphaeraceae bacterium]|nr:cysteine--tRNA ligase [Phycisphaeraceae bacterium]